jgi:hypothetical protein
VGYCHHLSSCLLTCFSICQIEGLTERSSKLPESLPSSMPCGDEITTSSPIFIRGQNSSSVTHRMKPHKVSSAIKFYYEVTGRYNPRLQVDVNVDSVMNRVVEIIQKHVRDPQVLMAIADDLEDLANGKPRDTPEPVVKQVVETTAVPMLGLDHGEEVSLNLG